MKQVKVFILLSVFLAVILLAYKTLSFLAFVYTPASQTGHKVLVNIKPGAPFSTIVKQLLEKGVVSDKEKFVLLARLKGVQSKVKAGEIEFNTAWKPLKVIDNLVRGKEKLYKITIPEGYNIYQIASLLSKTGFLDGDKFLSLVKDREFLRSLDFAYDSLEGYLFPSTYKVSRHIELKTFIRILYTKFTKVFDDIRERYGKDKVLDDRSLVILASMIEKETSDVSEMPLISSVFYNRLRLGMKMQSDPTVIYGMWQDYNGNIKRRDLRRYSPYNTYVIHGLPAGPIANPGKSALIASFKPVKTEYLFFVSNNNGRHIFTKTYAEHKRKVYLYQIRRR